MSMARDRGERFCRARAARAARDSEQTACPPGSNAESWAPRASSPGARAGTLALHRFEAGGVPAVVPSAILLAVGQGSIKRDAAAGSNQGPWALVCPCRPHRIPMNTSFVLDFKIALRMLVKYPLLTIVGGAGMSFGLAAGIGGLEIRAQLLNPVLPLDEGDRIVGVRNWDVRRDRAGAVTETDLAAWREQLQRVDDIGAAALVERNLDVNGTLEPIAVAEMTASAFRVARVVPQSGRSIVEADEQPGAPPVAVIGHSLWQRRFLADPAIVGRIVRLGSEPTTIVGVMPESFGFPVVHQVWTAPRPGRSERTGPTSERTGPTSERTGSASDGPSLLVFGRLAPGITRAEAQAELTAIAQRMSSASPETHEFLRAEVVPYSRLIVDTRGFSFGLGLANIFLFMLMVVVSANVALLMFARAASRETEIGVRHALGASRARIVLQLFLEAVVLSGLSAIVGLAAARYGIGALWHVYEAERGRALAFWFNDRLTLSTMAYGVGLTMIVAVIIGVLPALKVTGQALGTRLRQFSAGGGGYRFGGVWTVVIAAQVAVTVLFPATAFFFHRWVVNGQTRDVGFAANEYLSARLVLDAEAGGRTAAIVEELRRQLSAEAGVAAVTIADTLPGLQHPGGRFEVEGDDAPPTYGYDVRVASVDSEFFGALGAPVLSGRSFAPTDIASGRDIAIVNASFVEHVLRGRNPVGRRVRLAPRGDDQAGPWLDIVGVVRDLGISGTDGAGLYRPLSPDSANVRVALRIAGGPEAFRDRLRAVASSVDPTLRVYEVMRLDRVGADQWLESQYLSRALTVFSGVALLLSLMAIYAVMAFTVVQRTREIGTRVALGADRWRVIAAIARRPLVQIGLGIGAGGALVVLIFVGMFDGFPTPSEAGLIAAYATTILAVCLSACVVPIRRALRLEPSQVLRADA